MLSAANVSKAYGDRILFSGLTFNVAAGDCIALVGPNGSGKTTLLDILAGEISPDTGSLSKHRNATIGYLKQELALFSGKTLIQEVLEESSKVTALRDRIAATHEALSLKTESGQTNSGNHDDLLRQLSRLEMELEAAEGGYMEHEAKAILSGLGFKQDDFFRHLAGFSGGWLMRAALGKLLFRKPDVLLLDEPTNHLDLDANLWFEKYLSSFRGAIVVTSHDRAFLNQVATMVLAIAPDEVILVRGDYDDYLIASERSLQEKRLPRPGRTARSRGRCALSSAFATRRGKPVRSRAV